MGKNLDELKRLTKELKKSPDFEDRVEVRTPGRVYMNSEENGEGTNFGDNLLHIPDVSVGNWFSSKGSIFPSHMHGEKEWIIVYRGRIVLTFEDGEEKVLDAGEYCVISPNTGHTAFFPLDTWYLAITIPASEGWPK